MVLCGAAALAAGACALTAVPFPLQDAPKAGLAAEPFGTQKIERFQQSVGRPPVVSVTGNNRLYLFEDEWEAGRFGFGHLSYQKLFLLGKTLRFTVDLSGVHCSCDASIYLVAMGQPTILGESNYCDIQGVDGSTPCTEIDLIEGNRAAVQTTLHTRSGHGPDGSCNQDGCAVNYGKDRKPPAAEDADPGVELYGPSKFARIDSRKPFTVVAMFATGTEDTEELRMTVAFEQYGLTVPVFDSLVNGNPTAELRDVPQFQGVPIADQAIVNQALRGGMVLAVSLWRADDLSWLDGGCEPKCNLDETTLHLSNLEIVPIPPPPMPPPSPTPPPPSPRPLPPSPLPPPPPPSPPPPALLPEGPALALWVVAFPAAAYLVYTVWSNSAAIAGASAAGGSRAPPMPRARKGSTGERRAAMARDEEEAVRLVDGARSAAPCPKGKKPAAAKPAKPRKGKR